MDDSPKIVEESALAVRRAIAYFESESIILDPVACLDQPFDFLLPPPPRCPTLIDIHGKAVFFQISWHCYRLAIGDAKPLFLYRDSLQTVKGIIKFNRDAREKLIGALRNPISQQVVPGNTPRAQVSDGF